MGISTGMRVAGSEGFLIGIPQKGHTGRLNSFLPVELRLMAVSSLNIFLYLVGPGISMVMQEPEEQVLAEMEGPFFPGPAPIV
jgi:hypothetical protein